MALRKRLWLRIGVLAILGAAAWLAAVYHQISGQAARDEVRPADAIVVFGAAEYSGHPSPVFRARLDHAVMLYKHRIAPLVITTGGAGEDPHFSEGGVGRSYLLAQGIPENAIIAETQGSDTSESAHRVGNIMRTNRLHTCVAVSDGYHLFRIKKMLGSEGLEVYGSPRADARYPGVTRRFLIKMREALGYTWWKLGLD
jgi:uncharacterized SAM-binding protein YcdF (DUF218 family)